MKNTLYILALYLTVSYPAFSYPIDSECEVIASAKLKSSKQKTSSLLIRNNNERISIPKGVKTPLCLNDQLIIPSYEVVEIKHTDIEEPLVLNGFTRYSVSKPISIWSYLQDFVESNINKDYQSYKPQEMSTRGDDDTILLNGFDANGKESGFFNINEEHHISFENVTLPIDVELSLINGKNYNFQLTNKKSFILALPDEHPMSSVNLNVNDASGHTIQTKINFLPIFESVSSMQKEDKERFCELIEKSNYFSIYYKSNCSA